MSVRVNGRWFNVVMVTPEPDLRLLLIARSEPPTDVVASFQDIITFD